MRSRDYDPRPVDPPTGPLTTILTARQTLPCAWHQCITPIRAGQPVVLLDSGWIHALHIEETP